MSNGHSVLHQRHSVAQNAARCTSDRFGEAAPRHRGRLDWPLWAGHVGFSPVGYACPILHRCFEPRHSVLLHLAQMFGLAICGQVVRSKVSLTKTWKVDEKPIKLISSCAACCAAVGLSVAPHRTLFCIRRAFEIYINEKGQRSAAITFAAFEYSWARCNMYPEPSHPGILYILYNVLSGKIWRKRWDSNPR